MLLYEYIVSSRRLRQGEGDLSSTAGSTISGKPASLHSGKWSRSSSLTRSKADDGELPDDAPDSEFHLASCNLDSSEDCPKTGGGSVASASATAASSSATAAATRGSRAASPRLRKTTPSPSPSGHAPKTARRATPSPSPCPGGRQRSVTPKKTSLSGIPLPTTAQARPPARPRLAPGRVAAAAAASPPPPRPPASAPARAPAHTSKHTLEVQFLNKSKRLAELKKELLNAQKPVLETYQSLLQIKKKLNELGKCVKLDEIRFVRAEELQQSDGTAAAVASMDAGDAFVSAKTSIEQIPKTLMEVCRNLLCRRSAIVELLETVSRTEVEPRVLEEKVRSLKSEGVELQRSLDAVITEHEKKIEDLVGCWQRLIRKQTDEASSERLEEMEVKVQQQEKLLADSQQLVVDLQKRLEERKGSHDRVIAELEGLVRKHEEKVKKMEYDIEQEKRINSEHKNRNTTSVSTIKSLKNKIQDLETRNKEMDSKSTELTKKLSHAQDNLRIKESLWTREKEDMVKSMRSQDLLLTKLTADRNHFETRCKSSEDKMTKNELRLTKQLDATTKTLITTKEELDTLRTEKGDLETKCAGMEEFLKKMSEKNEKEFQYVTERIDWGKPTACSEAELLSDVLSMKIEIRNYEDKVKSLEDDVEQLRNQNENMRQELRDTDQKLRERSGENPIARYQALLEESEKKLHEKCKEISNLQAEIRHLKMRQNAIDEQNESCPTSELMKMVNEGKSKMGDLIRKSMENDQKLHEYEAMVEKQQKQMLEMENLLKMRNGLLGVMKSKKDELQLEKESLTRYSNEMRGLLFGIKEDLQSKSDQIQDLSDKLEMKERTCGRLEKKISELEENLAQTNEQRYKLQDTISLMEKELQTTKAQINSISQLPADQQTRTRLKFVKPF